ncbi:Protein SMG7 [Golovinomyces cichoracearum]|uniref:Protein SMG7 n=1 Tax=Golovinomyces cichoracearum TaxID=62708 RepID=A0A420J407_9PEZI|nr:Protein SMG7 [Golovinomyces cichoracearum]
MLIIYRCAQEFEKELLSLLHAPKPTYEDIEDLIHEMRSACEHTIFLDFEFSARVFVEKRLWHAHTLINNRYRKILGRFKDEKKHVVEKRKIEKHYVDFIKTSQFFYKGYIQRLASRFSGIKGLLRVAGKMCLDSFSTDPSPVVSPETQIFIEKSCHATLLQLGDLSRYRNMLRAKKGNWEPAMGYYQLANEIDPLSGMAHNKMAVIALADENHLNAVYHLYRAVSASKPDPLAPGNLEIEFKKILASRHKTSNEPTSTLIRWFILLHANFNEGIEFSSYEELQNEVILRLSLLLKEDSCAGILEKFAIISIAAQHYSNQRLCGQGTEKSEEAVRTFTYHVTFNCKMMSQLLSTLLLELEEKPTRNNSQKDTNFIPITIYENTSIVARRILPALRYYTLWLASSNGFIHQCVESTRNKFHSQLLWNSYAAVLTKLVNHFPVKEMTQVPYLLEEDEITIGFKPFRSLELVKALDFYSKSDGQLKPYTIEYGNKRSDPNVEMQSRILDIVCSGIQLQMDEKIPLQLQNFSGSPVFNYTEKSSPVSESSKPASRKDAISASETIIHVKNVIEDPSEQISEEIPDKHEIYSDSEDSVEISMNRMVDSLLEPSSNGSKIDSFESFHGIYSRASNESFSPVKNNSLDYQRKSSTPKLLPSLPGLYSSAFTPQPNELQSISPRDPATINPFSQSCLISKYEQNRRGSSQEGLSGYTYRSETSLRGSKSFLDPSGNNSMAQLSASSNHKVVYMRPDAYKYGRNLTRT